MKLQGSLPAADLVVPAANLLDAASSEADGFGEHLKQAVLGVNEKDRVAGERMADVDSGRSDDLVGAMLSSQEASLSFSMLMQVRNKMVGAMDDLIKLPL
ncbi:MAG: flagellar hook-basal body complex protein FliE [Proteobacteria bacterium]|nr:flagellar hook-basal body complex protein FliE [Pseudomonadota bacterium]